MADSSKRVYWDSCSWIALILDERISLPDGKIENRGALCRAVIDDAKQGKVEIVSSALVLIEVSKRPTNAPVKSDTLIDFFENDYVLMIGLDQQAGKRGHALMQEGHSKLKPADASHLASAAPANVEELHTFDGKLLALDGKITKADGTRLRICKPSMGGPPLPLMEAADEAGATGNPTESGSEMALPKRSANDPTPASNAAHPPD